MDWNVFEIRLTVRRTPIAGLALLLLGCGAGKEVIREEPLQDSRAGRFDESFDPMTLNDDDLVILPDSARSVDPPGSEQKQQPVPVATKEMEGFRVQILATNNIESASLSEQEANARFEALGHKTYLVFEAPLYKIRLGDCLDRKAAEELRDKAMEFGYSGAFIVRTKVLVNE
jgi:hypothetical protein